MRYVKQRKQQIILLLIIALGSFLRFYNLNWDQGHHLHPDERAIVMFTTPLSFPNSIEEFLSPESPLNPHFFAYGNFPLYLLKATASLLANFDPLYLSYEKINLVGRGISAIADVGTLILIFLIGKKLFNKGVGLLAAFFYAISVFPIQAAHFYAVDTLLTFFITLTLYQLIRFYQKPSLKNSILVGVCFGASLVTKISATVLLSSIGIVLIIDFVLIFLKNLHRPHVWFPHIPKFLKRLFIDGIIIAVVTVITFFIFEPYAIIDSKTFWQQTQEQRRMTYDAFTFPFTLQYVGKTPYLYELKNIFLWGLGPVLAMLSISGFFYVLLIIFKKQKKDKWAQELILLTFVLTYFFVVGKFAVGWMRYMLPLYPLLSLFGAVLSLRLFKLIMNLDLSKFSIFNFQFSIKSKKLNFKNYNSKNSFQISNFKVQIGSLVVLIFICSILIWPLSFMHIYTKPNTRVLASEWIYQNIPPDKKIALEHWDDGMPIGGNISYRTLELPIYEMQNPVREAEIYQTIQEADYIIIASNRLYTPLQRLAKNCQKWNLPSERCSHNANRYYEKLFNGELGYKKVVEFSVFPQFSIFNPSTSLRTGFQFSIDDSSADESFTVYDHPKIMIFKKILF